MSTLLDRLRHRAMYSRTAVERAYWRRALARNRGKLENIPASGISDDGVEFIAEFEGFVSHPYRDPVGVWTIGYGSTRNVGPKTKPITRAQARARLKAEVNAEYAPAVRQAARRAGRALNQAQFDALVSAVYNLGPGVLAADRSLGDALRRRQWRTAVADALLLYDKAGGKALPGLTRRRQRERRLWLKGEYR